MKAPVAVVFAMPEDGHVSRLMPVVSGLRAVRFDVYVFAHRRFRAQVERTGAGFVDLFGKYPLDAIDAESLPVPCRFVSFAGVYAEQILKEVSPLRPDLVVYDTFAVIGPVIAKLLRIPYVNVCAGHNVNPERFLAMLRSDPRVALSTACEYAVSVLRKRYGFADASPFAYVSALSPFLNLYCEPPAYLTDTERKAFEPIAFFGSLPTCSDQATAGDVRAAAPSELGHKRAGTNVYVSFGTVVWRYYREQALNALTAVCSALAARPRTHTLVSFGRFTPPAAILRALSKPTVLVSDYVDQWAILHNSQIFVTHQGLSSTHEAIFLGVPMLSYPFFWDQPSLAEKCRGFGFSSPLAAHPLDNLKPAGVEAALERCSDERAAQLVRLAEAREWEQQVMDGRGAVLRRIRDLI